MTQTLVAASCIETFLCACVMTCQFCVTLVDVDTGATVSGQRVANRTSTDKRAGCVVTVELTRRWRHRLTLVYVYTLALSLSDVHLVASVTQTPV